MYGWIWRALPGGRVAKAALCAVVTLLVAALLWYVVFPRLEPYVDVDRSPAVAATR